MSVFTPLHLNLAVTVAATPVTVGEASETIIEDTVDVADFWAPGLNYDMLKPYGRYARFVVHGVEASSSLTAYVLIPWGPPVVNTMQAWQRGLIVIRYLPPIGIDRAFVDVQIRVRRQHDVNHQTFLLPLAGHPSFLFRRISIYKRLGDQFGRLMSFSLPRYRAILQQFMALGDTHAVLDIRLTVRQPQQMSRFPNMPLELLNLIADKLDLASVVRLAQSCKMLRLGTVGREDAVSVPTSPLSLEFAPPSRQLPLTNSPSLLGNRVAARVVAFLEPLLANGRARSRWLGSFRYTMAVGNVAIIHEGVRAIINNSSPGYNYFFVVPSPAAHLVYEELEAAGLSRLPGSLNISRPTAAIHTLEREHGASNGPACTANVIETQPGRGGIVDVVRCVARTTATMNFMTHEKIVCLVPSLTLRKRFAINTMAQEIPWFNLGSAVVRLVQLGYTAVDEFPRGFCGEEAWACPW